MRSFTTEVDYCNLHPRLSVNTMEGVKLKTVGTAYDIKGVECERSFIKKAYLSVLFSETKRPSCMSVLNSANKLGLIPMQTKNACKAFMYLIRSLKRIYKSVSISFLKTYGLNCNT